MKKNIKKIIYATTFSILTAPVIVSAQASLPTQTYGLVGQNTAEGLIMKIINFLLTFVGSLAILMIVVGGIMYMTSGGDEGRTTTAKKILIFAIAGLVIVLLSYLIVAAINNALTGSFTFTFTLF